MSFAQYYDHWVPNDHTFAVGPNGNWHIFGITHPLTSADNIHEGEVQLFHAETDKKFSQYSLESIFFKDKGNILSPCERPGEIKEIHSPFIVKKDNAYYMIYGPSPFRMLLLIFNYSKFR